MSSTAGGTPSASSARFPGPSARHAHIRTSHGRLVATIHEHHEVGHHSTDDWHDERAWVPADAQKERPA